VSEVIKLEAKQTFDLFSKLEKAGVDLSELLRAGQVIRWIMVQRGVSNWATTEVKVAALKAVVKDLSQLEAVHAGVENFKTARQAESDQRRNSRDAARGLAALIKAGQNVDLKAFSPEIRQAAQKILKGE